MNAAATAATPTAPLVSVVMNGFNSARYLAEAIDSVVSQTHSNWEIVFWDNCSDDATEAIVARHADRRIRFFRAPRRMTLAEGRNEAIARCRGDWVAFLDCDDVWLPCKLRAQLARVQQAGDESVGLVYARTLSFSSRGAEGETAWRYAGQPLPEGDVFRTLLLEGNLIPIVSALVSRSALDAAGPIPANFTFAEDYWLFVAIARHHRVLCVQHVCCRYRVHEGAATYRNKLCSHREALAVLEAFGDGLGPAELNRRRRVYHTLIGIEKIRTRRQVGAGLADIVARGSLPFLAHGAARHVWRRIVRNQRPYA
jgi:glycosyltransferase involved in cell wall biosynthesis